MSRQHVVRTFITVNDRRNVGPTFRLLAFDPLSVGVKTSQIVAEDRVDGAVMVQ